VRWGVAGSIVAAWLITLPAAGLFGAAAYAVVSVFGHGATGPMIVALLALAVLAGSFAARRRQMTAAA
jgi:inorganic phosphate transporter, PiT family